MITLILYSPITCIDHPVTAVRLAIRIDRTGVPWLRAVLLAAITETLGVFDEGVFNAATGLSGGLGLEGDSTCSALLGGVLAIGLLYPRTRQNFSGGRENKYANFYLTQQLIDHFRSHFGSLRCHVIHTRILGRPFDLRSIAEREAFEEAGAHADKCTITVALAARWTLEILAETKMEQDLQE